jgi:UPF0042 nucleotide-binding protein
MRLVIVSGVSGSGKSIALSTLEDVGYYCIDNLPVGMLKALTEQMAGELGRNREQFAVGIDARNSSTDLEHFPALFKEISRDEISTTLLFLQADDETLLKRFSETRRKHPLTDHKRSLADAVELERALLDPLSANADLFIDTTHTTVHQLRELVRERMLLARPESMSLLFESFGYKHGIPTDADFVFDSRCLPNPHWEPQLRPLTGLDEPVADYLRAQPGVGQMLEQIESFLDTWIPCFEAENRSYMTVAVGCTGGQHRSVYLTEALGRTFRKKRDSVLVRHRELP